MSTNVEQQSEDDDVVTERKRIHADTTNSHGDVLRLVDLVKVQENLFLRRELRINRRQFSFVLTGVRLEIWKNVHSSQAHVCWR